MKLAWMELRRRPGRFGVATAALAFLALLLLFLGALLDGLFLGSTGAIRAQRADAFVYSSSSRDSFLRSTVTPAIRAQVEALPDAAKVGGLGVALTTATVPDKKDLADVAVIGYEIAPSGIPLPPKDGEAYADRRLEGFGVKKGQKLKVGLNGTEVTVVGMIDDGSYLLEGGLWTTPNTWRTVLNAVPDRAIANDAFQVLIVQSKSGNASALTKAIDSATKGATSSLTKADAEFSLPGTKQQNATFNGIIGTTFAVSTMVVALFFALLTLERLPLYGVLKAMGSSSRQLFSGVVLQAIVVSLIAFSIGALIMFGIASIAPPEFPIQLTSARVVTTAIGLAIAAIIGSLISLRRVIRTDPASAIGA